MKNKKSFLLLLVLVVLSLLLAACSGAAVSTTAPTSVSATAAANTPEPTLTSAPAPSDMPSFTATLTTTMSGGFPVGTYEPDHKLGTDWMRFEADGKWVSALFPTDAYRAGRYIVDGDKITFLTDVGICKDFQSIYQWKINGNVLTFVVIDEGCTASSREADLTGSSWIKQP